jgi:cyclase
MGAGEILINSIDNDGMMNGYDHELLKMVVSASERPVIACGGAGNFEHLAEAFNIGGVHAVACASLFHFGDNNPIRARSYLKNIGISVKNV